MLIDNIRLLLKDIFNEKSELRSIKQDLKSDEKNEDENYLSLKKTYKDLKTQIQDIEDEFQKNLLDDQSYNELWKLKISTQEKIAQLNSKLMNLIQELPPEGIALDVETNEGVIRVNISNERQVYFNGKRLPL